MLRHRLVQPLQCIETHAMMAGAARLLDHGQR